MHRIRSSTKLGRDQKINYVADDEQPKEYISNPVHPAEPAATVDPPNVVVQRRHRSQGEILGDENRKLIEGLQKKRASRQPRMSSSNDTAKELTPAIKLPEAERIAS